MENQRDKPIRKFEDMSGFKELGSEIKTSKFLQILSNSLLVLKTLIEVLRDYFMPIFLNLAVITLIVDFIVSSGYSIFKLSFLCILLFYKYKKEKLH